MSKRTKTDFIAIHCSATPPRANIGAFEINAMHVARGFTKIGYHYVICRNGTLENGRQQDEVGAHVLGYNDRSVGICLVGGTSDSDVDVAENNFTKAQFDTLKSLCAKMLKDYPGAIIKGHRDFSPDLNHDGVIEKNEFMKECPCFDAMEWAKNADFQTTPSVEK